MQLHPTLGNATHLSYKSRLMKHKPAAFITKPRKLKAASGEIGKAQEQVEINPFKKDLGEGKGKEVELGKV